jgi:hypothetical protein
MEFVTFSGMAFYLNVKLKMLREKYNLKIMARGNSSCEEA